MCAVFCKPILAILLQRENIRRRFWKAEQTFQSAFSNHVSTFLSQNPVLKPLKSASKRHSESFVRPSKIFVWDKLARFTPPKRRFWKAEPTFQSAFSKHFSTFSSPNRVLGSIRLGLQNATNQAVATRPRNPRFPSYRVCIQTTFPARMSILKSGIPGSGDSGHKSCAF